MRRLALLALAFLVAQGCRDALLEPEITPAAQELVPGAPALTRALAPAFSCTRSWAAAVDGDWYDGSRWSPAGAPGPTDNVCIDVAGTYEVTLDYDGLANIVKVGGLGALATLTLEHSLLVDEGILVETSGHLVVSASQTVHMGSSPPSAALQLPDADWFENHGIVEIEANCVCSPVTRWAFRSYENHGFMYLAGPSELEVIGESDPTGRDFLNRGFIVTSGTGAVRVGGTDPLDQQAGRFIQEAGSISGTAPLVLTFLNTFEWSGGPLPVNAADPAQSVVVTEEVERVLLLEPDLAGALTVRPILGSFGTLWLSYWVEGTVGPDLHLMIEPLAQGAFFLGGGDAFTNRGTIDVLLETGETFYAAMPGVATPDFLQDGLFRVSGQGTLELAWFGPDGELANSGSMEISSGSLVRLVGGSSSNFVASNSGSIVVAPGSGLEVEGVALTVSPGSRQTGSLLLKRSELRGSGALGDVELENSMIAPAGTGTLPGGAPPGIGMLTLASLALDRWSEVEMDVAGTTPNTHDQLRVAGAIHYAGTLTVRTHSSFTGGQCGQVVPLISDGTPAQTDRGSFGAVNGVALGGGRAWRFHNPTGLLALAGYRPGPEDVYATASTLSMREGGPAKAYQICLGSGTPAAEVVVAPTALRSQLTLPAPFTFAPDDWFLPRTVAVQVIDDAVVEGLHGDTIVHVASSADPAWNSGTAGPVAVSIQDNDGLADLGAVRVAQQDNQFLGDTMHTTFRVTNAGPTESSGSTFVSTPLVGLAFVSATGASCASDGAGVVTCAVGPVPAGGQVDFEIAFEGVTVGLHSNTWTVTGEQPDPNPANDAVVYTQRVN
ncbi:MAG: DUF11 domain-containing protein [Gemmatimonadota bacterium]